MASGTLTEAFGVQSEMQLAVHCLWVVGEKCIIRLQIIPRVFLIL